MILLLPEHGTLRAIYNTKQASLFFQWKLEHDQVVVGPSRNEVVFEAHHQEFIDASQSLHELIGFGVGADDTIAGALSLHLSHKRRAIVQEIKSR